MDFRVLELVFFLVVEDNAVLVNEVNNAYFPQRTVQKLEKKFILPSLRLCEIYVFSLLLGLAFLRFLGLLLLFLAILLLSEQPLEHDLKLLSLYYTYKGKKFSNYKTINLNKNNTLIYYEQKIHLKVENYFVQL